MVFATFAGNGGGGWNGPPRMSRVLEHIATKFQRLYPYIFGVKRFSTGTADVMERRCVLEILDGSQITGSTLHIIFAGFTA